ncbi:hypothetical protein [uncultured Roseivirga sp.]|uniref:hypothetical protein n=1 Tax=uncultured Roseivirga sp. TaxID=543088 RepID=UPI0030D9EBAA|tara:strand:- start:203 stop:724 length:522 start_codon:yes stop_codon:yes gene_type:complete
METYINRVSAFDKEQVYTLDVGSISNGQTQWDLKDIHDVHLSFKPTKSYGNVYQCEIESRLGKIILSNRRYLGPANFEYQSGEYRQFVSTLLQNLDAYGLANFKSGKSESTYWLEVIASAIFFGLLLLILAFFGAWIIAVSFLAVLVFRLVPYYKKNRPMNFSAKHIPSHMLP